MMRTRDNVTYRTFWVADEVGPLYLVLRKNASRVAAAPYIPPHLLQALATAPAEEITEGKAPVATLPASSRLPVVTQAIILLGVLLGNGRRGQRGHGRRCALNCRWRVSRQRRGSCSTAFVTTTKQPAKQFANSRKRLNHLLDNGVDVPREPENAAHPDETDQPHELNAPVGQDGDGGSIDGSNGNGIG